MTTPFSLLTFGLQLVRDVQEHGLRACLANGGWVATRAFAFVVVGGVSLYAVAIVPHFLKRRRRTRKMMERYWGASLAIAVLVIGLTQALQPEAPLDKQTLFQGLLAVVWLMYFRTSSEVAGTFINE